MAVVRHGDTQEGVEGVTTLKLDRQFLKRLRIAGQRYRGRTIDSRDADALAISQ